MNEFKDTLPDTAISPSESAGTLADDVQDGAKGASDSVQHETNCVVRKSSAYVKNNPVPTALVAFAAGLVVGVLLNQRGAKTLNSRYIAEPLHQSRAAMFGVLLACGALLR